MPSRHYYAPIDPGYGAIGRAIGAGLQSGAQGYTQARARQQQRQDQLKQWDETNAIQRAQMEALERYRQGILAGQAEDRAYREGTDMVVGPDQAATAPEGFTTIPVGDEQYRIMQDPTYFNAEATAAARQPTPSPSQAVRGADGWYAFDPNTGNMAPTGVGLPPSGSAGGRNPIMDAIVGGAGDLTENYVVKLEDDPATRLQDYETWLNEDGGQSQIALMARALSLETGQVVQPEVIDQTYRWLLGMDDAEIQQVVAEAPEGSMASRLFDWILSSFGVGGDSDK